MMADLKELEYRYSKDYRTAFEDMVTLMFCIELGLPHGVNRRINQKGIESDPVEVDGKKYAYQAKCYEPNTNLSKRKKDIINSIMEARSKGVTDLMLFVNKNLPDTNPNTDEEAKDIQEIHEIAKGTAGEASVNLDWWTRSKIETSLDMDKFSVVKNIYFNTIDGKEKEYSAFYNEVYKRFSDNSENSLFGSMSLQECYIETSVNVGGERIDVSKYIEKFVLGGGKISVICGEPGHGKTSLCHKAMCDFYKKGWLANVVSNVFCFSLNPARTDALSNDSFDLYQLLSWGNNRKKHVLDEEDCINALIFFDGFDELLEWYPKLSLEKFIEQELIPFERDTGAHIIITSRTMAVEPGEIVFNFRNGMLVLINRLQPISRIKQYKWIEKYIQHVRKYSPEESEELENYYRDFPTVFSEWDKDSDSLKELLGIPIIFRMIVAARYLPKKNQRITGIYDDLFDVTWKRHRRQDDKEPLAVKAKLAEHALHIFIDNNDTAETNVSSYSTWLFSFYTTNEGKSRIGFLHRSFYQYFLAHEIFSWYEKYARDMKTDEFEAKLSYLGRRRLDGTTLEFIQELYFQRAYENDYISMAFEKSYKILQATDGILPAPVEIIDKVEPLKRANNIFHNIISIGSICNISLLADSVNDNCLQTYDLSSCILFYANWEKKNLSKTKFSNAYLMEANLSEVDLSGADLSRADLSHANLNGAKLAKSNLSYANLNRADLGGAELYGANLEKANFKDANLRKTNFSKAYLMEANLSEVDLSGADLSEADLRQANLKGAKLGKSNLSYANLNRADLGGAELYGADLKKANFKGANLRKTNISNADLQGANFERTDLSETDLSGTDFSEVIFSNADLSKSNFSRSKLNGTKFNKAILRGVDFSGANLSGADLREVKLSGADFTGATLIGTKLCGTRLNESNFNRAILPGKILVAAELSKIKLSGAFLGWSDLRWSDLNGADLSGADLSGANLRGAILRGADLRKTNLSNANLSYTDLRGIILNDTIMIETDVEGAKMSKDEYDYICKQGVKNFAHVCVLTDDE